jgi:hypothetical protein
MRMQRWVLGTLLVTWTAGCASPMPMAPAMPAANSPMAAPMAALTPATKSPVEKAYAKPAAPLISPIAARPVVVAPIMLVEADLDPVMATANAVFPTNLTDELKLDLTTLAVLDEELTAKQLSVASTSGFGTKGWFSDLKEKFNNWNEKRKVKKEAKKQLMDNEDFVAKQQKDKVLWFKKNRDEPTVTTNPTPDGGKEVITVWTDGKGPKTATVTLTQIFDDEGVEQSAILAEKGQKSNNQTWETIRSRKIVDENATREIYTKRTMTDKKSRSEIHEFTRIVKADRTETLTGTITNRNGKVTTVTGSRNADGKLTIETVSPATGGGTQAASPAATPDW